VSGNSTSPIPYSFQVVNPANPGAQPGQPNITSVDVVANVLTITWTAEPGKIYRVQSKANLNDSNWSNLSGDVTASAASASKVDSLGPGDQQKFYRIQVVQ